MKIILGENMFGFGKNEEESARLSAMEENYAIISFNLMVQLSMQIITF
jgi:hypothetical protein